MFLFAPQSLSSTLMVWPNYVHDSRCIMTAMGGKRRPFFPTTAPATAGDGGVSLRERSFPCRAAHQTQARQPRGALSGSRAACDVIVTPPGRQLHAVESRHRCANCPSATSGLPSMHKLTPSQSCSAERRQTGIYRRGRALSVRPRFCRAVGARRGLRCSKRGPGLLAGGSALCPGRICLPVCLPGRVVRPAVNRPRLRRDLHVLTFESEPTSRVGRWFKPAVWTDGPARASRGGALMDGVGY